MALSNDARSKRLFDEGEPDQVVTIEVDLHEAQQMIFSSQARFRVVAAGRRFGKTVLGAVECLVEAIDNPGSMVWWVAPTNKQTRIAKRQLTKMLPRSFYHINNTLGEFTLANGSHIFLRSAERFDNLRGEGVDFMVVDEAAFVDENAWVEALRPTLSDKEGGALLIGTFKGENWFWKMHEDAQDPDDPEWEAFTFPTSANPYIAQHEIDAAKKKMPRAKYLQEYEASPQGYEGQVFDGELIQEAVDRGRVHKGEVPARYREAGIDWGWHCTAMEVAYEMTDDRMVWVDEYLWENIELNKRCREIVSVCKRHNLEVLYCDAAGATECQTLAVALSEAGLRTEVQPVPFNEYKETGIDARRYYQENRLEDIAPVCRGLISDSKRYHYNESTGKPEKGNDHTVDAATALYASRAELMIGYRPRSKTEEDAA